MNARKNIIFCLILISLSSCITINISRVKDYYPNCELLIKDNTKNWKKDRLGFCGLRDLIVEKMEELHCNLNGLNWNEVSIYLGEPNTKAFKIINEKKIVQYNYFVNTIDKKKKFEQKIISIFVNDQNFVDSTCIWINTLKPEE